MTMASPPPPGGWCGCPTARSSRTTHRRWIGNESVAGFQNGLQVHLHAKRARSFLTMLGIIIGVASVVIMVSVVQGQNRQTMEMFEKHGRQQDHRTGLRLSYDTNNETCPEALRLLPDHERPGGGASPLMWRSTRPLPVQYGAKTIRINDWNNGSTTTGRPPCTSSWALTSTACATTTPWPAGGRCPTWTWRRPTPVCVLGGRRQGGPLRLHRSGGRVYHHQRTALQGGGLL